MTTYPNDFTTTDELCLAQFRVSNLGYHANPDYIDFCFDGFTPMQEEIVTFGETDVGLIVPLPDPPQLDSKHFAYTNQDAALLRFEPSRIMTLFCDELAEQTPHQGDLDRHFALLATAPLCLMVTGEDHFLVQTTITSARDVFSAIAVNALAYTLGNESFIANNFTNVDFAQERSASTRLSSEVYVPWRAIEAVEALSPTDALGMQQALRKYTHQPHSNLMPRSRLTFMGGQIISSTGQEALNRRRIQANLKDLLPPD